MHLKFGRVFTLTGALALSALLCGCPRVQRVEEAATPPPITPPPVPTPPPTPFVPNKKLEVGRIFNGMQIRTTLETDWGTTATAERNDPASYAVDIQVKVRIPKPHQDLAELSKLNPQ